MPKAVGPSSLSAEGPKEHTALTKNLVKECEEHRNNSHRREHDDQRQAGNRLDVSMPPVGSKNPGDKVCEKTQTVLDDHENTDHSDTKNDKPAPRGAKRPRAQILARHPGPSWT